VTFDGQYIHLADSQLLFPPAENPPLSLGVRGEKSLRLSGRIADGTILAEYSSPAYIRWAREQIAAGQREAGITKSHRLTVFAICYLNHDVNRAYEQARASVIAAVSRGSGMLAHLKPMGILPQLEDMRGRNALDAEMPEKWVHDLVIFGNPEQCRAAILRLVEAGVDSIVLVPPTDQPLEMPSEIGGRLLRFLK
jgi:alkanesulfonate monooxygenase SsuD/methylene tetrahydromethanopterin reductase-like flavin-dependent oxidoreductase (luciferase family)